MRGYVDAGLASLEFTPSHRPKTPIVYITPTYGSTITQTTTTDLSPPATKQEQSYLRKAVGIFRYYAQAIDGSILFTLSKLAIQQEAPTQSTMKQLDRFLNYIAYNKDASITYRPSNMQLQVHSDESYCSEPKSRSRSAGFSTCGPIDFTGPDNKYNVNGPIRSTSVIIPSVVTSATEASYASLYLNAQDAEVDRQTLRDLGHPQKPTHIIYDNVPAGRIANRSISPVPNCGRFC